MILVAPLLFLLNFASLSLVNAIIACAIFFVLWIIYTVYLFRRRVFKAKYKNMPENVWQEPKE
jgi:uncharacterized oligopeptide transporter (OPT) family protein